MHTQKCEGMNSLRYNAEDSGVCWATREGFFTGVSMKEVNINIWEVREPIIYIIEVQLCYQYHESIIDSCQYLIAYKTPFNQYILLGSNWRSKFAQRSSERQRPSKLLASSSGPYMHNLQQHHNLYTQIIWDPCFLLQVLDSFANICQYPSLNPDLRAHPLTWFY